jgi:hypothetical protein
VTAASLTERCAGGYCGPPWAGRWESGAVFEAPALVTGLNDVVVMGEPVEQCRGHLGVAEDRRPLGESQVGGDDDRGLLVEPADQVEQQLAAGLGERQIAELVENEKVEPGEPIGDTALPPDAGFGLQPVDQVDRGMEAALRIQARAMATARWLFPEPVPPTSTALRWFWRNEPVASSRTSPH